MEPTFNDLLFEAHTHLGNLDEDRLRRVFDYASKGHLGQERKTGDPYITHSLNIAHTLTKWGLDQVSIEAGLLHDLPEMSGISIEEIAKEFGDEVAGLVEGVNLVGQVRLRGSQDTEFLENLRKMFFHMAKDIRAVLIRLADRRHNILTLDGLPLAKQRPIALETLEVYVPLAERIGMGKLKSELEDLVFPYVYPEEYKWITELAKPHFKHSMENVPETINRIRLQLSKHGISAQTDGRPKHKYSLFRKLMRPEINRDISKIYDLMAVRIITQDVPACYSALGVIHQYWKPVPFLGISDFIAQPKPNGYQSIHTKVFDNNGNIIEIQIRSEEMHLQAEYGASAHFAYSEAKNKGVSDTKLEKGVVFKMSGKMSWIRQLANWQQHVLGIKESLSDYRLDALVHHIFVFSPKGDVYDLPENSTPVDYAFNVHSSLGFYIQAVKINDKIATVDETLKSGDVVSIVKSKNPKMPNKNWLRFVKTHRAKIEIRKAIQEQNKN